MRLSKGRSTSSLRIGTDPGIEGSSDSQPNEERRVGQVGRGERIWEKEGARSSHCVRGITSRDFTEPGWKRRERAERMASNLRASLTKKGGGKGEKSLGREGRADRANSHSSLGSHALNQKKRCYSPRVQVWSREREEVRGRKGRRGKPGTSIV